VKQNYSSKVTTIVKRREYKETISKGKNNFKPLFKHANELSHHL